MAPTKKTDKGAPLSPARNTRSASKRRRTHSDLTTASAAPETPADAVDVAMDGGVLLEAGLGEMTPSQTSREKKAASTDGSSPQKKQLKQSFYRTLFATKPSPAMDVIVHRVRHLNFHPKPILCMRVTPPSDSSVDLLAISRSNGSVELKSAGQKLRTVATIAGYREKPINVMSWTCGACEEDPQPALVGASRDGTLCSLDFESTASIRGVIRSGGGGVFALTSLCQRHACRGLCRRLVAAGCEDGSVRIFRLEPNDRSLVLVSTLPSTGAAILSLVWTRSPSDKGESNRMSTILYAGVADGTIRRFEGFWSSGRAGESFQWKAGLRMTVECYGRATPTRVWALEALSDGILVSTDSLGHVQFWDGNSGSLLQSFDQNDNKADVLALAVTADECKVFVSGVDSRVVCIERQPRVASAAVDNKWIVSHAQSPHTHDVNAIVIYRQQARQNVPTASKRAGPIHEILCTGGLDTKLCTYQIKKFQKKRPRTFYPWPVNSIAIASNARLFTMMREDSVDIYRVGKLTAAERDFPVRMPDEKTLLGKVEVKSSSNLACATIKEDGSLLAMADASCVFLFRLDISDADESISPSRLPLESSKGYAVFGMSFAGEALVLACSDGKSRVVEIEESEARVVGTLAPKQPGDGDVEVLPVSRVCASKDGQFFATVHSGARGEAIHIYKTTDDDDFRHWWTLPALERAVSAVSFLDESTPLLAVGCINFGVYVFDLERKNLSKWSEEAGLPVSRSLPSEFSHRSDYPVRISTNPGSPSKFLMVGARISFGQGRYFGMLDVVTCWFVTLATKRSPVFARPDSF